MKYFEKLYKPILYINRMMSSFKAHIWEDSVFVNSVVCPGDPELKLIISLWAPKKMKKVNLNRSPNDTIQTLVDRLCIKLSKIYKTKCDDIFDSISVQVDGIAVSDNSKCSEVFEREKNVTLQIGSQILKVIVNAPIINALKLGEPPYKGLMLYPYEFDKGYNVSITDSKYLWFRIDSKDIIEVGNEIAYMPTASDVNCRLKLICSPVNEDGEHGPEVEILSSIVRENNIEIYPYENRLKKKLDNSIRIVSYNILAGEYAKTNEAKNVMYPYCSEEIMASSYRNPLLLNELKAYEADIYCLQEVESNLFHRELGPLLKELMNMKGHYFRKSTRKCEGLSCFYSSKKFTLLKSFNIRLNDLTTMQQYIGHTVKTIVNDTLWKQALEKKTVLQVLVLELNFDKKQLFLVCNTHLISNPEGDSIRLFQALVQLIVIKQIKQNMTRDYPERSISVIFSGDFNSTPESGVFDLVTKLSLPEKYVNVKLLNDLKSTIDFKMHSAYDTSVKYTNYTHVFSGLLDYIYFTNQHLELIQVLSMPPHVDVTQYVGLPSKLFPSDHLALIADFKLK